MIFGRSPPQKKEKNLFAKPNFRSDCLFCKTDAIRQLTVLKLVSGVYQLEIAMLGLFTMVT